MRIPKDALRNMVARLNVTLTRPATAYTRPQSGGPLQPNAGHLCIESNSPGDGYTRYQLGEMCERGGGMRIIGNRTMLGASNFYDFLTGFNEGVIASRQSDRADTLECLKTCEQYLAKLQEVMGEQETALPVSNVLRMVAGHIRKWEQRY